jgi:hypothetical protein
MHNKIFGKSWRRATIAAYLFALCGPLGGQNSPAPPAAPNTPGEAKVVVTPVDTAVKKAQQAIASTGTALTGTTNIENVVFAQAVLLPRKQAERVFSKEIGSHYAVVQVTISNESKDADFLLHSIFLDYSQWALSGGLTSKSDCPATQSKYQATDCPNQVASVESRIIRGELQDAANWTLRNGLVRATVFVGAMASGLPAFKSLEAIKYVKNYNGEFVPGFQAFWPDSTVPQLNRTSDFGFSTKKVISRQSSDIVYAFFPIDRFLTPTLKRIFLKSPAIFFSPPQMFIDQHLGADVEEMKDLVEKMADNSCEATATDKSICPSGQGSGRDQKMLQLLLIDCSKKEDAQGKPIEPPVLCSAAGPVQTLIRQISLNVISVKVQGAMAVDVSTVPATITDITFDPANDSPDAWQETSKPVSGTITGRFLSGGVPELKSIEPAAGNSDNIADYIDAKTISIVSDQSNDAKLSFKLQWKKAIPPGSKLHFVVAKYDAKDTKKTAGVSSMEYVLPVNYQPKAEPGPGNSVITKIGFDGEGTAATWKAGATISGHITGSALDGATPKVTKLTVPADKNATPDQYIDTIAVDPKKNNDASNLYFSLKLKKDMPTASTLTLQVVKSVQGPDKKSQSLTSDPKEYTVTYK